MCSSILHPWKVFCFSPPVPAENSSLLHTLLLKFQLLRPSLPLGISDDLPWVGMDFSETAQY